MNHYAESILNAIEKNRDSLTDQQYLDYTQKLMKLNSQTEEGLKSDRLQREKQQREDEIIALELHNQLNQTGNFVLMQPLNDTFTEYTEGIVTYYTKLTKAIMFIPDRVYHIINAGGIDCIRNPRTGIFIPHDTPKAINILKSYGLSLDDFLQNLKR